MPRGSSSGLVTEMKRKVVKPILFYEGEFTSGLVNLWTGPGTASWNGKTWTNLGKLMGITTVTEAANQEAQGIACTLSGVPNDIATKALTECKHGFTGTLWLGALDSSGAIVADPAADILYRGLLDFATLRRGRGTSTIEVRYEQRILDKRARLRRYTLEDQQADFPGDLGPAYINDLMTQNLNTGTGGIGNWTGLGCFCGRTRLEVRAGEATFAALWVEYRERGVVELMTDYGPMPADIIRHEEDPRRMLDMGGGELVTLEHDLRWSADHAWLPARELLSGDPPLAYFGAVYTAHIRRELEKFKHFRLANGWRAHNKQANPGGG